MTKTLSRAQVFVLALALLAAGVALFALGRDSYAAAAIGAVIGVFVPSANAFSREPDPD